MKDIKQGKESERYFRRKINYKKIKLTENKKKV